MQNKGSATGIGKLKNEFAAINGSKECIILWFLKNPISVSERKKDGLEGQHEKAPAGIFYWKWNTGAL